MKTMVRNLVIGYGNPERRDDGVAFYVVNRLRRHLAQPPLDWEDNGLSGLGRQTDSVFVRQVVPELIDIIVHYDRLIFVDAHVPADMPNLACARLYPHVDTPLFSHHLHPALLLGFLKAVRDQEPLSHLLSIQASRFELERGLSVETAALVDPAAAIILELLGTAPDPLPCENPWSDGVVE
jgi:hydrogenase maturation protease